MILNLPKTFPILVLYNFPSIVQGCRLLIKSHQRQYRYVRELKHVTDKKMPELKMAREKFKALADDIVRIERDAGVAQSVVYDGKELEG